MSNYPSFTVLLVDVFSSVLVVAGTHYYLCLFAGQKCEQFSDRSGGGAERVGGRSVPPGVLHEQPRLALRPQSRLRADAHELPRVHRHCVGGLPQR